MGATESNLGSALRVLGEREGGAARLGEAVTGVGSRCRKLAKLVHLFVLPFPRCYSVLMSSRYLHPLACRLPRAEREAVVAIAILHGVSISRLIKEALRHYLGGVNPGVNPGSTLSVPSVGPKSAASGRQSPQPKSLAEAYAASLTVAPPDGKSIGSARWVETDIGLPSTFLNRRLKPRPQRQPPRDNCFIETS